MICLPPNFQYKKWTSARVRVRAFQQQSMTHIVAQGPLATFVDIDTCGLRALNLSWAFQTQARGGLSAEQCTANAQRCFWARVTAACATEQASRCCVGFGSHCTVRRRSGAAAPTRATVWFGWFLQRQPPQPTQEWIHEQSSHGPSVAQWLILSNPHRRHEPGILDVSGEKRLCDACCLFAHHHG